MTRTMIPFEEVAFEEGREEGREEGMLAQAQEAILEFIAARFDIMPFSLETAITEIKDITLLKSLIKTAAKVSSLKEFEEKITEIK